MASSDLAVEHLSASSNGRPISVVQTASPGTTLHTPGLSSPDLELVTLYGCNVSGSAVDLTLELGGTSASDQHVVSLPAKSGAVLLIDRLPIEGASRVIKAFAGTTAVVNVWGRVILYEAPEN